MGFKEAVEEFSAAFERRTRDNGDSFVCLRDDALEWMRDVCFDAHEGMPEDWRYFFIRDAVEALEESEAESADDAPGAEEYLPETFMTRDALRWLSESNCATDAVDAYAEECGVSLADSGGIVRLILGAMQWERIQVLNLVANSIESNRPEGGAE